jgi:hypothetical protein
MIEFGFAKGDLIDISEMDSNYESPWTPPHQMYDTDSTPNNQLQSTKRKYESEDATSQQPLSKKIHVASNEETREHSLCMTPSTIEITNMTVDNLN